MHSAEHGTEGGGKGVTKRKTDEAFGTRSVFPHLPLASHTPHVILTKFLAIFHLGVFVCE